MKEKYDVAFKGIETKIIELLLGAESDIKVAVAWITNKTILDLLNYKRSEGINITIILMNDETNLSFSINELNKLISNGCSLHFCDPTSCMHNKFCIIDNSILITGSYNWTYAAENKNKENIIIIENNTSVIKAYSNEFEQLTMLYPICKNTITTNPAVGNISDTITDENDALHEYLSKIKTEQWILDPDDWRVTKIESIDYNFSQECFEFNLLTTNLDKRKFIISKEELYDSINSINIGIHSIANAHVKALFKEGLVQLATPFEEKIPIATPSGGGQWPYPNIIYFYDSKTIQRESFTEIISVDFDFRFHKNYYDVIKEDGKVYFDFQKYIEYVMTIRS